MSNGNPEEPWYGLPTLEKYLLEDVPRLVGLPARLFERDVKTLAHRLAHEGETFLTSTLPQFGREFDAALTGMVPLVTRHFKKISHSDARPAFLRTLLRRVFDEKGWVLDNPCTVSIRLTRQLLLWCKKVQRSYSDESILEAVDQFIQVDRNLPDDDNLVVTRQLRTARAIIMSVFGRKSAVSDLMPGHGPGAVCDGRNAVEKRRFNRRYRQVERWFRPVPFFFSLRDATEQYERVTNRMSCEYGLSRMSFVPKEHEDPRTIGLEPAEYMWVQQALKRWMYSHIEKHWITAGRVNFTDQTVNQKLTSEWDEFATLDMSKASDSVSLALVRYLFQGTWILPYLLASRTPGVVLPSGEVLFYRKFAPMGSAVCFPVEAVTFFALACASIHHSSGITLRHAFKKVFVYGDDIILPREMVEAVFADFSKVGLKFNTGKSFYAGKFRESCGRDAYDGVDVTPVRLRRPHLVNRKHDPSSIVEHHNMLFAKGYRSAATAFLRAALKRYAYLKKMRIPYSTRTDLPILTLFSESTNDVRVFTKDSIAYVRGWMYKPDSIEANSADEMMYYRESLSLGGPVGEWALPRGKDCVVGPHKLDTPGCHVRRLAKKYSGRWIRKKVPASDVPASNSHGEMVSPDELYEVSKWLPTAIPKRSLTACSPLAMRRLEGLPLAG